MASSHRASTEVAFCGDNMILDLKFCGGALGREGDNGLWCEEAEVGENGALEGEGEGEVGLRCKGEGRCGLASRSRWGEVVRVDEAAPPV